MKLQEIKTSKFDGFGVLVPEDSQHYWINENDMFLNIRYSFKNSNYKGSELVAAEKANKYKIIGISSELTEEQAKEIVDETNEFGINMFTDGRFSFVTALESFNSLMQSLEMYSDNPLGNNPYKMDVVQSEWQQAQQRTGRWLIIKKL